MFDTKGQEIKPGGPSKSLSPGVVNAHILSGTVKTSNKGDKKMLELFLESQEPKGFEGWSIDKEKPDGPKYKGLTARIQGTIWTDKFNSEDINENEILNKIVGIAKELDLRDEIDALAKVKSIKTIEQYAEAAMQILKDENIYWFLKGQEEIYKDKIIIKLSLPKFKYCSLDQNKLEIFDKGNKYHYRPLDGKKPVKSFEPIDNDFEM